MLSVKVIEKFLIRLRMSEAKKYLSDEGKHSNFESFRLYVFLYFETTFLFSFNQSLICLLHVRRLRRAKINNFFAEWNQFHQFNYEFAQDMKLISEFLTQGTVSCNLLKIYIKFVQTTFWFSAFSGKASENSFCEKSRQKKLNFLENSLFLYIDQRIIIRIIISFCANYRCFNSGINTERWIFWRFGIFSEQILSTVNRKCKFYFSLTSIKRENGERSWIF